MNLDSQLLHYFNDLACRNAFWFNLLNACGNMELLRGGPVFACLIYVSLSNQSANIKSKIVLGLLGTCTCLVISLYCQSHLHTHLRPIFDKALNMCNLLQWHKSDWGNRLYSFPSDTATFFFALSAIIYFQNKKLGIICILWVILTVGISRVTFGIHYPSDILAGFVLGFTCVWAFSHIKIAQQKIEGFLIKYDPKFNLFNISVVIFCAEAYSLFPSLQRILHLLVRS